MSTYNRVVAADSSASLAPTVRARLATEMADSTSDVGASLSGTFAPVAASPRDTSRVRQERRPLLLINQISPNASHRQKIVWVSGAEIWAIGQDFSLRKSLDGGITWSLPVSNSTPAATWAKLGLFIKTAAGSLITTSHPGDLSAPSIIRSSDGGATWATVIAAQTDVDYLGVTSVCQDPVSGDLYAAEYVTVSVATKATVRIQRSTDDGVTWAPFHTFQRDAAAYPTSAVRHVHSVQWDTVSSRIYFLTGDAEAAAGIYRVNSAGTDVEKVVLNSETTGGNLATAVGMMFFPNYLAWGMDQTSDGSLVRMPRTDIGAATTASVVAVGRVQSTSWYTCRVASDGTEWLMAVSNEVSVGRVDAAAHVYRVADDGATMDEVLTLPTPNDTAFSHAYPIGSPLQSNAEGVVWLGTNIALPTTGTGSLMRGQQFQAILGWGAVAVQQVANVAPPFFTAVTQSSGNVNLAPNERRFFGVTEAPVGATRLYILEVNREQLSGAGLFYVEVWDQNGAAILKMDDGATLMQWWNRSIQAAENAAAAPYMFRSAMMFPGQQVRFQVREFLADAAEGVASITYAWGF